MSIRNLQRALILFLSWAVMMTMSGSGGATNGTGAAVTISGHLQYEKKDLDQNGFTGTISLKPIRFASVQVVRNSDSVVLNTASESDAGGNYSVTFTNTGPAGIYIRVLASVPARTISIKKPPSTLWAITSDVIDDTTASAFTQDLAATTTGGGGIFNLLNVTTTAAEFVDALTGAALPALTVYWSTGSCDGTFFSPEDNSIHVLGGCRDGNTDEYDDAVVTHEFGHFVASVYSRDDSPGGIHYLNDNTEDIRLAWSEGWGDFFSSAVRNDPLYVDTVGNTPGSSADLSFNLEDLSTVMTDSKGNPLPLAADAVYTTNEISVAAVLWDIFDDTPGEVYTNTIGTDAVSAGMGPIWDVVHNYFLCTTCGITNASFEDFWDGWFVRGHGLQAEMETVVADRKMAFKEDSFEPDDTLANAKPITVNDPAQTHTLYPAGDLDIVSFAATAGTTYTIETLGLTNGADTFIEVLDSNGNVVATNDNANGEVYSGTCSVNPITQVSNCPPNNASPRKSADPGELTREDHP